MEDIKRIALPDYRSGLIFFRPEDIMYCRALKKQTDVKDISGSYLIKISLKEMMGFLPEENFFRIHRSTLINLDFISRYENPGRKVVLKDNQCFDVSVRKVKEFKNILKKHVKMK